MKRSLAVFATLMVLAACAAPPAALRDMPAPVDAPEHPRAVAEQLAGMLDGDYVLPQVAARYAAMLRGNAAAGRYDGQSDAVTLAAHLTADLQAVYPDKHLRVRARDVAAENGGPPGDLPPPATQDARWIGPGIAYLQFYEFTPERRQIEQVEDFMAEHRDAKALIIDVRGCHGGTLDVMDAILPYLFAKRTELVTMEIRADAVSRMGDFLAGRRTTPTTFHDASIVRHVHVVTPIARPGALPDAPVFYLTSQKTASACEHLALAFKRTHRATLVGETTRGAGHFGAGMALGNALSVFVPVGRTFNPDTGWDWEGKGVAPDIAVPAGEALDAALARIR